MYLVIALGILLILVGFLILQPLVLLVVAKLLRAPKADFKTAFKANLLILAVMCMRYIVAFLANFYIPNLVILSFIVLITVVCCFILYIKIIKTFFKTGNARALGISISIFFVPVFLALTVRSFVVQPYKIPATSMRPTLIDGDHIFVNKFIYGVTIPFTNIRLPTGREPETGDIIVFPYPKDPKLDFINRVIAKGGETLKIRNNKVYINGHALEEEYSFFSPDTKHKMHDYGPITIPQGSLFVMGDNRNNSHDSRYWGFLDQETVKGKAFLIYWSKDKDTSTVRKERIGNHL